MWKTMAILLVIGACSDDGRPRPTDEELHEETTCSMAWATATTCEAPCAGEFHETQSQHLPAVTVCTGSYRGDDRDCYDDTAFEYEGVLGCCFQPIGERLVVFVVCDGE